MGASPAPSAPPAFDERRASEPSPELPADLGSGPANIPSPAIPPMPPIPPPPEPAPPSSLGEEQSGGLSGVDRAVADPFGAEPERPPLPSREPGNNLPLREPLPLRDGREGNVADIQELPGSPLPGPAGGDERAFPSSALPNLNPAPNPAPAPAPGFLPDLSASPPPPPQAAQQAQPAEPHNSGNGLPIDAPPPPPPPPGLDQLRGAGALPDGDRPSEWGRSIFDDDGAEDSGIRFGRP